jgi:capsular polysaccharide export protein
MTDRGHAAHPRPARTFLFLQGLASPFFRRLGGALLARGFNVTRINLNVGDEIFWRLGGSVAYRGRLSAWPDFLSNFIEERGVTDLVLFGDGRPYHRAAVETARLHGVDVHVFEEGYFRPNWITLESGGVNGFSRLPRNPQAIRQLAADLAESDVRHEHIRGDMRLRTLWDVTYNVANVAFPYFYPFYRRHRPQHPLVEYAGWLSRIVKKRAEARRADEVEAQLATGEGRYFLLPLQLDSDYQIRLHSPFSAMTEVVDFVARSFAANARPTDRLVVKLHPLDNGLVNRRRLTGITARKTKLGDRLLYLDGGHGPSLLDGAAGVVVVNSTIGTLAVSRGRPTIALGQAIYDMPGLTHQGTLESFWREPTPPDPDFAQDFRRVVTAQTQLNGGFYSKQAIDIAVSHAIERLAVRPPLPARLVAIGWARPGRRYGGNRVVAPGE